MRRPSQGRGDLSAIALAKAEARPLSVEFVLQPRVLARVSQHSSQFSSREEGADETGSALGACESVGSLVRPRLFFSG